MKLAVSMVVLHGFDEKNYSTLIEIKGLWAQTSKSTKHLFVFPSIEVLNPKWSHAGNLPDFRIHFANGMSRIGCPVIFCRATRQRWLGITQPEYLGK